MHFDFYKYSGTGNDFIVVDNRSGKFPLDKEFWAPLCARRTGIGADGVLLVEKHDTLDFTMRYLNADGGEVSMCGNGSRCISHFCHHVLRMKESPYYIFMTGAGRHEAVVAEDFVTITLPYFKEVDSIPLKGLLDVEHSLFLNTGVPHAVFEVKDVERFDVVTEGRKVRLDARFKEGSNANFFEVLSPTRLRLRTYERGVEDETLACGTGAVATAFAAHRFYGGENRREVVTSGGVLEITWHEASQQVFLKGKVQLVFKGTL